MEVKPLRQSSVPAGYKQTEVGVIPEEWEEVPVGSLASFTSGCGISVAALCPQSSDHPVPVFGGNGIAGYTKRAIVCEPTVVVGRVGQRCGEVYLTEGPTWITDNALYPRAIRRELDVRFLAMALAAARLNDVKNRNDLPLVTQSILHAVRVPWPPEPVEQRAIAEALSDVDELLGALDRLIAKNRDLKQAAMQQLLTGQTRLPGFHGEWEVKRLGELAKIQRGASPRPIDSPVWFDDNSSVGWVRISDVTGSGMFLNETTQRLSPLGVQHSRPVATGSLIMSICATVGRPIITKIDVCIHDGFVVFDNLQADQLFLYYVLKWIEPNWSKHGQTGSQMNLNTGLITGTRISLPSPTEQTAIAEVLTDMDAELAALEQRREKTRALKQAMMQELLTGRTRLI